MHYAPGQEPCPLPYSPFKACTVPRPIGWISTISKDGVANLAPYSQWQNLTFDPPMVMFVANLYADGRRKHTVINAEETGWFVWNMCGDDLRAAMNITAQEWPEGVDEFDKAGLTKAACIDAPALGSPKVPRISSAVICRPTVCAATRHRARWMWFTARSCASMSRTRC